MRFGVLGTGMVGATLATKLIELGHEVMMGSRSSGNEHAVEWTRGAGDRASEGTFADAAAFGEIIVNATAGAHSLDALRAAGSERLGGKVLIDVANALDTSSGVPVLTVANTDSLGESIQREFPDARVVKTLNTINCAVMVDPSLVPGEHNVFIAGNDLEAKQTVVELLMAFGWPWQAVLDLGDITGARAAEAYMHLWLRLFQAFATPNFNVSFQRG